MVVLTPSIHDMLRIRIAVEDGDNVGTRSNRNDVRIPITILNGIDIEAVTVVYIKASL